MYGSSRLGIWRIDTVPTAADLWQIGNYANRRQYELSNHLGNVMAVIGDYVTVENDTIKYPSVFSLNDYYVFGATKRWSGSEGYRYGFNGKENDNEVKGEGNQQDYGMRIYDPRLGKFLSIDPLTKEYPWLTPYQFASNTPVGGIDLDGAELAWGPGNFVWDLWMATKLKYKYGDPTGARSLLSGMGEKYMVSSRQMSYHNDNVPKNVQERLDESSLNSANAKMIIGGSKLVSFNIETSLEAASMVLPVETAFIKGYDGLCVFGLFRSQV